MSDVNLSTLSVILGLLVALPSAWGLLQPKAFAAAARRFPRHTPTGYVLMLLGTAWFLYYVSLETVSDFANLKKFFFVAFGAVGIGACLFVKDFLPVRGLAVLLLLAAKLMTDTARWYDTEWRLVIATWAYVWAVAGMWLTIAPWRLRDLIDWSIATDSRTRLVNGVRTAFGVFVILIAVTAFRSDAREATPRPLPDDVPAAAHL
jgi:hypothetical protein